MGLALFARGVSMRAMTQQHPVFPHEGLGVDEIGEKMIDYVGLEFSQLSYAAALRGELTRKNLDYRLESNL